MPSIAILPRIGVHRPAKRIQIGRSRKWRVIGKRASLNHLLQRPHQLPRFVRQPTFRTLKIEQIAFLHLGSE